MTMIVYVAGLAVIPLTYLGIVIIPMLWRCVQRRKLLKRRFPYPNDHWLFGELDKFPGVHEDGLMYQMDLVYKFPRYRLFLTGPFHTVVVVHHPEAIKCITNTLAPKQKEFDGVYRMLMPWIGDGLLLSSGLKWKRNRKLWTPGFELEMLKHYVNIYNERVETLLHEFEQRSVATSESIDIFPLVSKCTLDIILRCVFSSSKGSESAQDSSDYFKIVSENTTSVFNRVFNPLVYIDSFYNLTSDGRRFRKNCEVSHKIALEEIRSRMKYHEESDTMDMMAKKKEYADFLEILLLAKDEDSNGLTMMELRDEVHNFMFAGHDTAASGISWALYNLAKLPEIQERAREEVDGLLDGRDSDTIEWSDLAKLPYLTRCIKESLRLHSPVPLTARLLEEDLEIDGKMIPSGTQIDIAIFCMHRNPLIWKDPASYDPDRFLEENMKHMDPHAFMPFSAGPRNCIGEHFAMNELKTVIARVLRCFVIEVDSSKPTRMSQGLVLTTENGMHLFFKSRKMV